MAERRIRRKWFYGLRNQVLSLPVESGMKLLVLLSLSLLSSSGFKGPIGTPPRQQKLLYKVNTISSPLAKPFNLFVIALPSSYQTMSLLLWLACLWVRFASIFLQGWWRSVFGPQCGKVGNGLGGGRVSLA